MWKICSEEENIDGTRECSNFKRIEFISVPVLSVIDWMSNSKYLSLRLHSTTILLNRDSFDSSHSNDITLDSV
jgi:hypothetical protein